MRELDMSNYKATEITLPKIGWDDPNAVEGWCPKCPGMIPVPGRIYGYAGPVCMCGWKNKKVKDLSKEELIELLNQNS